MIIVKKVEQEKGRASESQSLTQDTYEVFEVSRREDTKGISVNVLQPQGNTTTENCNQIISMFQGEIANSENQIAKQEEILAKINEIENPKK